MAVITVLTLLTGILSGSLAAAKRQARLATCAANQRALFVGLMGYANEHSFRLPPFAFSDASANLPRSGHWAGNGQSADPLLRPGMTAVNLGSLLTESAAPPAAMQCTQASGAPDYFGPNRLASSYCLRMPHSETLFSDCEALMYYPAGRGKLLGAFRLAAGGQTLRVGVSLLRLPRVRIDLSYPSAMPGAVPPCEVDMSQDAWLADGFWGCDSADRRPRDWLHGKRFNVLYGNGSVRAVDDDGTVQSHSFGTGAIDPGDDGVGYATHVEEVWRFFDDRR